MLDYQKIDQELVYEGFKIVNDKSGWVHQYTKKGVEVYYKPSKDFNGNMFKFVTKVEIPISIMVDVMRPAHTTQERMKWDDSIHHYEMIQSVSNTIEKELLVIRLLSKPALFGAISAREFVDLLSINFYQENLHNPNYGQTYWIFAKSIEHPSCPHNNKYVRATNHPLGYGIAQDKSNPNMTHLELYVNTDTGGNLPQSLVEMGLPQQQIQYIETVKKEATRRYKASPHTTNNMGMLGGNSGYNTSAMTT